MIITDAIIYYNIPNTIKGLEATPMESPSSKKYPITTKIYNTF